MVSDFNIGRGAGGVNGIDCNRPTQERPRGLLSRLNRRLVSPLSRSRLVEGRSPGPRQKFQALGESRAYVFVAVVARRKLEHVVPTAGAEALRDLAVALGQTITVLHTTVHV